MANPFRTDPSRSADAADVADLMGFAFPKDESDALIASEPQKFMMPKPSDRRYNWVVVRLAAIDEVEMREIVLDAWRMVVPKSVAASDETWEPGASGS